MDILCEALFFFFLFVWRGTGPLRVVRIWRLLGGLCGRCGGCTRVSLFSSNYTSGCVCLRENAKRQRKLTLMACLIGKFMEFSKITCEFDPLIDSISQLDLWIRIFKLPSKYKNLKTLTAILEGNNFSTFLKLDPIHIKRKWMKFIRLCLNTHYEDKASIPPTITITLKKPSS
ncbi:hypothetical protein V2J09_017646 [Rumex salicifolius]